MLDTLNNKLVTFISFFLGFIFLTAGIEKLTGLPDIIGPHYLVDELAKYNLELYGKFIAFSQIIIGSLLIHNRFRLLGSIMLVPMLSNILVVTISLGWNGTPYIVAVFLVLNFYLLLNDFHKLKFLFSDSEIKELKHIKVKRSNIRLDLYYIGLSIIILIGAFLGFTALGKGFVRIGFLLILLSILFQKVYPLLRKLGGIFNLKSKASSNFKQKTE